MDTLRTNTILNRFHRPRPHYFETIKFFEKSPSPVPTIGVIAIILFTITIFIEFYREYDVHLVDPLFMEILTSNPLTSPLFYTYFASFVFPFVSLLIEQIAYKFNVNVFPLLILNFTALLAAPQIVVRTFQCNTLAGVVVAIQYLILALKLYTYHVVCHNLRQELNQKVAANETENDQKMQTVYPNNLTWRNMLYYVSAPTICYEVEFPIETKPIQYKRVFWKIIAQVLICSYYVVTWSLVFIPFATQNMSIDKTLKLFFIFISVWFLFNIHLLYLLPSTMADLSRFADREFSEDWWNSSGLGMFWRKWNKPINRFALRHIVGPMRDKGFRMTTIGMVVFLISGLFHEYFLGWIMQTHNGYITLCFVLSTFLSITVKDLKVSMWTSCSLVAFLGFIGLQVFRLNF